eukprot:147313_1
MSEYETVDFSNTINCHDEISYDGSKNTTYNETTPTQSEIAIGKHNHMFSVFGTQFKSKLNTLRRHYEVDILQMSLKVHSIDEQCNELYADYAELREINNSLNCMLKQCDKSIQILNKKCDEILNAEK